GCHARLLVLARVFPGRPADPHRGPAVPPRTAAPAGALRLDSGDDAPRRLVRAEAHGAATPSPASWSHAPASQFAASVTGSDPPITNPKYRPPALATVAAAPTRSRVASCLSAV